MYRVAEPSGYLAGAEAIDERGSQGFVAFLHGIGGVEEEVFLHGVSPPNNIN